MIKIMDYREYTVRSADLFNNYEIEANIRRMIEHIKHKGDEALFELTKTFDKVQLHNLEVTEDEVEEAYKKLEPYFLKAIRKAISNITKYHEKQKRNSWISEEENGIILGQKITPIEQIGIYVPGGTASYPSSVLMTVIPGKVAGVRDIIICTPPGIDGKVNPYTIVAARESGADHIYKIGGAQAIIAMAYGTESIPKVYKIFGPGNIYVTVAKKMVYGAVDIDMLAGPSEILVIADQYANPKYVAADLLSQAEHDTFASSILVTPSLKFAEAVQEQIELQIENLPRKEIIRKSLQEMGAILIVPDIFKAFEVSNEIAPEHLELHIKEPFKYLGFIRNAGAIFLGENTPEPVGDYIAGPSHVLPTGGTAKYYSVLSVDDYIKKSSIVYYSSSGLEGVKEEITILANLEGLHAHANSINIREGEYK